MKQNKTKKALACVLSVLAVAGFAVPANVGTGGIFGGTEIVAKAASYDMANRQPKYGQEIRRATPYMIHIYTYRNGCMYTLTTCWFVKSRQLKTERGHIKEMQSLWLDPLISTV
ncbi:MAG TPA: hypothetical protein DCO72_05380 [Ruminococcus sp.]|nr:hypothetical protein [Ruminococcus sp.]